LQPTSPLPQHYRHPQGIDLDYQALCDRFILRPDFRCGRRFFGLARLSHATQDRNGNFIGQIKTLREVVPSQGATLADTYYCVCPSQACPERTSHYRFLSSMAIKWKLTIVAARLDRFARPLDYQYDDPQRRLAKMTLEDFERLRDDLQGVPIMTILPAWIGAGVSHRSSIMGGRQARGATGGRPRQPVVEQRRPGYCADRHRDFGPIARFLHGLTPRPTEKEILDCLRQLGVVIGRATLYRWLLEQS
jgi:hypothetical protein